MPLPHEIHVFASHKGGTGKTQLCFQCACQYANDHPEEKVLVMDMTELGDLSKRCLGGSRQDPGVLQQNLGKIFDLVSSAEQQAALEKNPSVAANMWNWIRGGKTEVNILETAIRCNQWNSAVPDNLYLISSGACTEDEHHRSVEQTIEIANHLRGALEKDGASNWKVFLDTDGDRRPSPSTRLAYALGDLCIVPLQPDESDFARLEPMFQTMLQRWSAGEMRCKIQMIVWNKLQLLKKAPGPLGSFETPKVTTEMIQSLNKKLFQIARTSQCSEIFQHADAPTVEVFQTASTCLVRDFPDTCAVPANANGVPYCNMQPGKVTLTSGASFSIQQTQIDSCVENIKEVVARLDRMEVDDL